MAGTPLDSLTSGIDDSALAHSLRDSLWLFPAVETLHILGFVVLVGAAAMFDLRLLGLSRRIPVDDLARHLLPWSAGALLVVIPTGLTLFTSDAVAYVGNRAFATKLCLIFLAGCNAAAFHAGVYRSVAAWRLHTPAPAAAKAHAIVSLLLWASVIACGRMIAFV